MGLPLAYCHPRERDPLGWGRREFIISLQEQSRKKVTVLAYQSWDPFSLQLGKLRPRVG